MTLTHVVGKVETMVMTFSNCFSSAAKSPESAFPLHCAYSIELEWRNAEEKEATQTPKWAANSVSSLIPNPNSELPNGIGVKQSNHVLRTNCNAIRRAGEKWRPFWCCGSTNWKWKHFACCWTAPTTAFFSNETNRLERCKGQRGPWGMLALIRKQRYSYDFIVFADGEEGGIVLNAP